MREDAKSALVLIPCCKEKCTGSPEPGDDPIQGISPLRERLWGHIVQTPELSRRPENQRGILNANAPQTPAKTLYRGQFYQACSGALSAKPANVHILIVSAFYGLAQLEESLAEYELTMADRLQSGHRVYQFWTDGRLSDVLRQYVLGHNISFVWSLLPDSQDFPYHRIFRQFWQNPDGIECYHVKVFVDSGTSAGSGSGRKRGEWLNEIMTTNPALLCQPKLLPKEFKRIKGYQFKYVPA